MKLIKKTGLYLLSLLVLVTLSLPLANAFSPELSNESLQAKSIPQSASVPISVFERKTCPHCQDERAFLEKLVKERNDIEVLYHDIDIKEHREHFVQLTELDNLPKVTPLTLVGNMVVQGFYNEETTGKRILEIIEKSKGKKTLNFTEYIQAGGEQKVESVFNGTCDIGQEDCEPSTSEFVITVPLLGKVDLKSYSLPVLSLILGFIDGFNPCAMWVLIIFLTLLIQAGSRKKMLQIAGTFVIAEAIMYYLILNVWLTTWDFVGLDELITPLVGLVAVGGGVFFLYQWYKDDGTCKVTDAGSRQKTIKKISDLIKNPFTILTFLGIIGIAFSVNIIEFACSIGIPQAFTKILELNPINFVVRQLYMALYILMYMVDDLVIFGLAIYGFDRFGLTAQKYSKWCHLAGGILMLILGVMLMLAPDKLIFK